MLPRSNIVELNPDDPAFAQKILAEMKSIRPRQPRDDRVYAGEGGVNPAYSPLEDGTQPPPLCLNDQMIWCLRGDMILALE